MQKLVQYKERQNTWALFLIALAIFSVIRLGLFVRMPYFYTPGSGYDDTYLFNSAESIANGRWLGEYNFTTLIKNISFPLFLALSYQLSIPYSLSLGVYYIIAAVVFCTAIYHVFPKKWFIALTYLWLIFCPLSFNLVTYRVYRNAILFPGVIHSMGCILMVFLTKQQPLRKRWVWLVWDGFSFAFFYYIREDSIWMIPIFLGGLIVTAIWHIFYSKRERREIVVSCIVLLIPVLTLLSFVIAYKGITYYCYGKTVTNDRTGGAFAELTGNMIRIEGEKKEDDINIWITRKKLEKIIDECPTLVANKDTYLYEYDHFSQAGDHSVWSFRQALNRLGYFSSATRFEEVCRQINDELLDAVYRGALDFDKTIHFTSQARGMYIEEIPGLITKTFRNLYRLSCFDGLSYGMSVTGEKTYEVQRLEAFTGVRTLTSTDLQSRVAGWYVWKHETDGHIWIRITNSEREVLVDRYEPYSRQDVINAFPGYATCPIGGYNITVPDTIDVNTCFIQFYKENEMLTEVPFAQWIENDDIIVYVEMYNKNEFIDSYYSYNMEYEKTAKAITRFMEKASPMILIVSTIFMFFLIVLFCIKRKWYFFEAMIIPMGAFLSMFIVEFGVTLFNSFLGLEWFYSSGMIAMSECFQILSIAYGITRIQRFALSSQIENRA